MRLAVGTEPEWMDLVEGAAVLVKPPSTPLVFLARARANLLLDRIVEGVDAFTMVGAEIVGVPDLDSEDQLEMVRQTLFTLCLAELAILDWRGVLDDAGNELPFEVRHVRQLLSYAPAAHAFVGKYLDHSARVSAEGNV